QPSGLDRSPCAAATPSTPDAPEAPAAEPAVQVDVAATVAGQTVAVSVGDSCLGVELLGIVIGCDPPASDSTLSISTGGSLLPPLPPITLPPLLS
ncbi:MAG: hypothetical protein L0221_16505, partial [Chloroflexi bacterium]|nr:hypothetical protein [Chloroflexota bacterium]